MHRIAMEVGRALAKARGKPVGQHAHDFVESLAFQLRIRPGAMHGFEQRVLVPFAAGDLGHELLRQHIQRRGRHDQRVEFAAVHGIQQRRAFQQFVARGREQSALGHAADMVAGTADALQEGGDGTRRTDLANQVDVADVDAQFQRGGGDQYLQVPALELLLRVEPQFLRQ